MDSSSHSPHGSFPTTDWGVFRDLRGGNAAARLAALDILIRRYWKPAFSFLRYSGTDEDTAKDLTQAFFADWLEHDAFAKADENRGHFRSFMLSCLKRFAANAHRAANAQKRKPPAGLVSLEELMDNAEMPFESAGGATPEAIFNRTWATTLVLRVLRQLEAEYTQAGKTAHFDIFARRIIKPILDGSSAPALADLAREHDLTEKQTANHLLTAKRAYRRLMEEEIRLYAATEADVADEIRSVFRILGES